MWERFAGKKMNKKPDKETANIASSSSTTTYVKQTSLQQTTRVTESSFTSSTRAGNTFPRNGGINERSNVQQLTSLFSTDSKNDTNTRNKYEQSKSITGNPNKINLNYISPYKAEKDATPFKFTTSTGISSGLANQNQNARYTTRLTSPGSISTNRYRSNSLQTTAPVLPYKFQSTEDASTSGREEQKLKIVVKKNRKSYDRNNKIPTYSTSGSKRGSLLLINNIMFRNSKDRKGAEVDEKNLKELFKQLDFYIDFERNMRKKDMETKLEKYARQTRLKQVDINVVVIMSHGQGDKTGVTKIFGTDDKGMSICEILEKFNDGVCPFLMDKPKIFFFMCCRGDNEAAVETDTILLSKPSKDMLLAYSTLPGFVSYRNPISGTFYTRALCETFMNNACDTHVEDLLKLVEQKLGSLAKEEAGKRQTSTYENRGFKLCYLHPK